MPSPDPALVAETLALIQAQAVTRQQIEDTTTASARAVLTLWLALHGTAGFSDRAAVTDLARRLAAVTRSGQTALTSATAASWARVTTALTGHPVPSARLIDPAAVRPTPLESVFGRLADRYRWLEASRGADVPEASRLEFAVQAHWRRLARLADSADHPTAGIVPDGDPVTARVLADLAPPSAEQVAARIEELVRASSAPDVAPEPLSADAIVLDLTDRLTTVTQDSLTMAFRAQVERSAASDPKAVTGYRRVLHPELSRGGSCGLCVAASTRVYYRGALLPIHAGCNCTVAPFVGEVGGEGDPGGAINDSDLAALYDSAGSTAASDLSRTRWRIVDSPENGAQLVHQGQLRSVQLRERTAATGSRRAAARPQVDPATVLAVAERSVADLQARRDAGENVAAALEFQTRLLERMRGQLAA